jgi:AcrR family transcriptional regulator
VVEVTEKVAHSISGARRALLDAFAELALTRRYQDIGVSQIVSKARVARSTFYYHFQAKDELLVQNLKPFFVALAGLAAAPAPTQDVRDWIQHIWENRSRAVRLFEGATGRKITSAIAAELMCAFAVGEAGKVTGRLAPLVAEQIACAMLGLVRAWVAGRSSASPDEIAELLWTGARALAQAGGQAEPAPRPYQ